MYNTAATTEAGNQPVDQECEFSAAAMPKARASFSFWRSLSGANGECGVGRVRSGSVYWLHARRERREKEERKCPQLLRLASDGLHVVQGQRVRRAKVVPAFLRHVLPPPGSRWGGYWKGREGWTLGEPSLLARSSGSNPVSPQGGAANSHGMTGYPISRK